MKKLDETFVKHGHFYKQVWRDERAAVYEYRNKRGAVCGYEAIRIRIRPERILFGVAREARELYPADSQWGKLAVTRPDLESALERARQFSSQDAPRRARIRQLVESDRIFDWREPKPKALATV
jgi:hypothetical protein